MRWWVGSFAVGGLVLVAGWRVSGARPEAFWPHVSPGALSAAHTFIGTDCAACHTPVSGPDPIKCMACHASSEVLLKRESTAFHSSIGQCIACHSEHRGPAVQPAPMDHRVLATLARRRTDRETPATWKQRIVANVMGSRDVTSPARTNPWIDESEARLVCGTCHSLKDPHQQLFGPECGSCHRTDRWTIPRYLHPSDRSRDCEQCHQAPPSHYMMHFEMVSQVVARQPRATVDQCFLCHQATRWNDIRGVGWYKHH